MVKSLPAVLETRVRSLGWEDPLGKEMATNSSILAWKIPWAEEESGEIQSMGSQRMTPLSDFTFTSLFTFIPIGGASGEEPARQCGRRKRHGVRSLGGEYPLEERMATTPVSLPRESHGQRSLEGYSPWGHKELDTTEATAHTHTHTLIEGRGPGLDRK